VQRTNAARKLNVLQQQHYLKRPSTNREKMTAFYDVFMRRVLQCSKRHFEA
jgi:hypothetical protein